MSFSSFAPFIGSHILVLILTIQWERGFALYYLGRYREAAEQFCVSSQVDPDDVEPYLWRCMSAAKVDGWAAAQDALQDFHGWDKRLCMMQVFDLWSGRGTVEEV